jgi:uncharacterized membrane protein
MTPGWEATRTKRLDAFVDAAFAFAVTLLVISTGAPTDFDRLGEAIGRIPAFAASFALIVMFWLAYRDLARLATRRDSWSTALSLAIVFVVLVYVFPLRVLVEAAMHNISGGRLPGVAITLGDLRNLYIVYGLGFVVLASLFAALYAHAWNAHAAMGLTREARPEAAEWALIWTAAVAAGLLSASLAAILSDQLVGAAPGLAYFLIPLAVTQITRLKAKGRFDPPDDVGAAA